MTLLRYVLVLSLLPVWVAAQDKAPEQAWIPLCGKCLEPSVNFIAGVGTAHAEAEGKVTKEDAEGWCANWTPDDKDCVQQQLQNEAGTTYRISADCPRGRLTSFTGDVYKYAGVWTDDDIGKGRPKFRGADSKVVPRDNASGGLTLAAQWELLCPAKGAAKQN